MQTTGNAISRSARTRVRIGRALSAVAILFLLFDSLGKLLKVAPVVAGTRQLGYPEDIIRGLGVILLTCVVTYAVPRLSLVGSVLLTGYLGGAVATHVRVWSPLLTHGCSQSTWRSSSGAVCCFVMRASGGYWNDRVH